MTRSKLYLKYLENPEDIICPDRKEDWIMNEAKSLLPFLDDYIDSFTTISKDGREFYNEGLLITDLIGFKEERDRLIEIYGSEFADGVWIVWSSSLENNSLPYLIKKKKSYGKKKYTAK